jgi:hypothetical protein
MLGFLGDVTSVPCHATMQSTPLLRTRQCTSGVSQQDGLWALLASDIVEVRERFYGDEFRCLRGRIDL